MSDNNIVLIETISSPSIVQVGSPSSIEVTLPSNNNLVEVAVAGPQGPPITYLAPQNIGNISGSLSSFIGTLNQVGKYEITVIGDIQLLNPSSTTPGVQVDIYVKQDTTGNRKVTFDTNYMVPPGSQLSSIPGTIDLITLSVLSDGTIAVRISNGVIIGPSGMTQLLSSFTVPALDATNTAYVLNGAAYPNGCYVLVPSNPPMVGLVVSGGGTNNLVLKNTYSSKFYGQTATAGSNLPFSGPQGINGTSGTSWYVGYTPDTCNLYDIFLDSSGNVLMCTSFFAGDIPVFTNPPSVPNGVNLKGPTGATGATGPQGPKFGSRVTSQANSSSITPNISTTDIFSLNNSAIGTVTINAPSGTPTDGQLLLFRVLSSNIASLTWNTVYKGSSDLGLPTTLTGSSKTDYFGFIYNSTTSSWNLLLKLSGF